MKALRFVALFVGMISLATCEAADSLTGHENEIPDKTNVSFVDDYKPKPTGAIADSVWATEKLTPTAGSRSSTNAAV